MSYTRVAVGTTTKGHRVWLQGTSRYGWPPGTTYTVYYAADHIVVLRGPTGRSVTAAKGGIIDLCSKKVSQSASGHGVAVVGYGENAITITFEG